MDREQLRSLQKPLKDHYRTEPAAALVTLHAEGELGSEDVSCSVQTGQTLTRAGLHAASGGEGGFACSGDMLLQALVACAGVTLRSVATNRGIRVTGSIHAEGDLDFSGIMGVDRGAPVGFSAIRLRFDITSDAEAEDLQAVIVATERYCTVYQTLSHPPALSVQFGGVDSGVIDA